MDKKTLEILTEYIIQDLTVGEIYQIYREAYKKSYKKYPPSPQLEHRTPVNHEQERFDT